jgi:Secretion system C-terminal sorting domain
VKSFSREVCPNTPYIIFNNDTIYKPYKSDNIFLKSDANGCDSITYLHIYPPQIQNPIVVNKKINLCNFTSGKYDFYGRSISQVGLYDHILDCDKDTVIQIEVTKSSPITYVTLKINAGDTVRGRAIFNNFTFFDTYPNFTSACDSEVVTAVIVRPTAVLDLDETALKIYPNPFKDKITLDINASLDLMNVEMQDILGRKMNIQQDIMSKNKGQTHLELTLLDVPKGVYFIKLMFKNGYALRKIVKSD